MIRYTNKEVRERPFTKEDVIATAKANLCEGVVEPLINSLGLMIPVFDPTNVSLVIRG